MINIIVQINHKHMWIVIMEVKKRMRKRQRRRRLRKRRKFDDVNDDDKNATC